MNGDRDRKALSGVTGSLFRHLRMMNGGAPVNDWFWSTCLS